MHGIDIRAWPYNPNLSRRPVEAGLRCGIRSDSHMRGVTRNVLIKFLAAAAQNEPAAEPSAMTAASAMSAPTMPTMTMSR
jgi:hypothetical protein